MFDFSSLGKKPQADIPASLIDLFSRLDRRATHTSLRPVQVSALQILNGQLDQRDVVIKLSTGSGKTVVGLVYAEMNRRRYKGEPSIYLCPTNQLVDQVLQTGNAIGVKVSTFPDKGYPYDAFAGETVLACTYDRLFNSKSVFKNKNIMPSSIVLDDVHAGVERVKGCYTANVPSACFQPIRALLAPLCERTDPGTWNAIQMDQVDARYEVPFWVWSSVQKQIFDLLEKSSEDEELLYRWENINRYPELARFCISGTGAEISLPIAAVEENAPYAQAKHRLFMSASIKDGSFLIADLGCDPKALERLVEPPEDEGAGERMILPTSLISHDAAKQEVAYIGTALAKQANVVVLTSSEAQAVPWVKAGATLSKKKDVDAAIERLKARVGNYVVFAQRFDGVDLPDDACRVLVIDGVPVGERLCDRVDASRQKDSPAHEVRTVNRFEQALGRAVRSSADYAAVILVGTDIAAFIGKKSVRDLLEGRTQVQVELGKELAKMAPGQALADVITGMVKGLMSRDPAWKDAHRARVADAPRTTRQGTGLTVQERVAVALREAYRLAKSRNFQAAIPILREASNDPQLHPKQKAEVLYRAASYLHQFDAAAASGLYRTVFEVNSDFPRPEQAIDKKFARATAQAVAVCQYFGQFVSANAAIAALDEIKAKLSFANPAAVLEQGLFELGTPLGASASRPEKETKRGPDVLWLFDEVGFCIEAKNEKRAPISKTDAGQLVLSHQWCSDHTDLDVGKIHATFATDVLSADRKEDVTFGPRVLNEETAVDLIQRLRSMVVGLSFEGPLFSDHALVAKKLSDSGLAAKQILERLPVFRG